MKRQKSLPYYSFEKSLRPRILGAVLFFYSIVAFAQPSNDDCNTAITLNDVTNFCSNTAQYNNINATVSGFDKATCFVDNSNDVWFRFIPTATDVNVIIRGATQNAPGGTLQNPEVAIYFGNCTSVINQLECQSDAVGNGIVEAYQGGLFVGQPYLIRVQGMNGNEGSFQICINNYNYPVEPTSDCPDAAILCDKSPFVVESVTGAGSDNTELDNASCFFNGVPGINESNSTWFTWICDQPGTLTFTLTPLNLTDDLDFVVYRLPNGVANCNNKEQLRCMASGDNPGNFPSRCMGPTGLNLTDTDTEEDAGCGDPNKNNFLAALNMVAGEAYALCVNNFTSTGNSFGVEFGGTGTFLGPKIDFTTDPDEVCIGTPVDITDASTFQLGTITSWAWSFGAFADPQTETGPGDHTVTFNQPGLNSVVLSIETDLGCRVTEIKQVLVHPNVEVDTLIGVPDCNGGTNGSITVDNIAMGTAPFQYSWENGPFQSDNTLSGLGVGNYSLTIRDANNCETDLVIEVRELELTVEPLVTPPLCFGESNGEVTLNVTNGTGPFQFDWMNNGTLVGDNTMGGFSSGTYTVPAQDVELCKGVFEFTVPDNPILTLTMDTINISCFGENDGVATANPFGGVGNYTYQWSNGATTQSIEGLREGEYTVTVNDGNECSIEGSVYITEPGELDILLIDQENLICYGDETGTATVEAVGGSGPFVYSSDGENFGTSPILTGLTNGIYDLYVEDSRGCRDIVQVEITSPPEIVVFAQPDTTLDLGFTVQVRTVISPLNDYTYEWTPPLGLNCFDCPEPIVTATQTQSYVIKVTNEDNCMGVDSILILVNDNRPIYAPNVFDLTKDYPNDRFTIFGGPAAAQIDLLQIYDRWGELVFEREGFALNDPALGWDGIFNGKNAETGVYTYIAYIGFVDGKSLPYSGSVTLLR